ncbi:hypothetical protein Tco_0558566 [Tanacetum coccineum]
MDLTGYEVPRVLITCRSSTILEIIQDDVFDRIHDQDAVSLCCLGILHLVFLGVEAKCRIPDWMLRLANDRVGWDNFPWGSFVWPTLYSQLKNANVKRWPKLYASQDTTEIDKKAYSIFGYTWAFKSCCLEEKKGKLRGSMVYDFFHGNMPAKRLTPNETEARAKWWISSRAYFDGGIGQSERLPRHLNRQNMYEVPSELYRHLEEQKREIEEQKKVVEEIRRNEAERKSTVVPLHSRHIQTAAPSSILVRQQIGKVHQIGLTDATQSPLLMATAFPSHRLVLFNWQSSIISYG